VAEPSAVGPTGAVPAHPRAASSVSRRSRIIAAPPEQVFPWLVQMGFDRGGWYAIDRLEQLAGVGRFATGGSARRIEPALQDLAVGGRMPLSRSRWLEVAVLDAPRELTLVLPPGRLAWTWRFTLEPVGPVPDTRLTIETRLSLPVRSATAALLVRVLWRLLDLGHGVMERVQLRTLARRVPAAALLGSGPERRAGGSAGSAPIAHPDAGPSLGVRRGTDEGTPQMSGDTSTDATSSVTSGIEALRASARAWAAGDPDPVTRDELLAVADAGDAALLGELMSGALEFGTAGLRGRVGPGPDRMNRAVVIRTTRALVDHLLATDASAAQRGIVVGFDARPDSERFAIDAAGVIAAAGVAVHRFPTHQPTPLCAFAQKDLDAAAAIVVTASHNPPADNGYKVYVEGAAQIVPPTDAAIARAITALGAAADVPRVAADMLDADPHVQVLGDDVARRYLDALPAARPKVDGPDVRIAYTPLHGVGRDLMLAALGEAGYHDVHVAPTQAEPDGTFPTLPFPNPEEPGALDAVIALAREVDADLVLAHDPDADRLAVAVPDGRGEFVALSGNRIGVLLAEHCLSGIGAGIELGDATPLIVSSIVSTPMVSAVAADHGARNEVTLTGFKWIAAAARGLAPQGFRLVYGFEEALGSCVGGVVADKDGISAGVAFADLARRLKGEGDSVLGVLAALHLRHGLWVSHQTSLVHEGAAGQRRIAEAMAALASSTPRVLGGAEVRDVRDFRVGVEDRPAWLGAHDLVAFTLDEGRVMIRPSGTEPKVKIYVDVRGDLGDDAGPVELAEMELALAGRASVLADDLAVFTGLR
jgi:phosphomannomutase